MRRHFRTVLTLAAAAALAACAGAGSPGSPPQRAATPSSAESAPATPTALPALSQLRLPGYAQVQGLFVYSPSARARFVASGQHTERGAVVTDGGYRGWHGLTVPAYIVRPAVGARGAGLLWVGGAASNRSTFIEDAIQMAAHGATSLLIDPPFSRTPSTPLVTGRSEDGRVYQQTVVDLRIGLDLLQGQFGVRKGHSCAIGHSFGASVVSELVGVDHRLRCAVIMSGSATVTSWLAAFPSAVPAGTDLAAYAQSMTPYAPLLFIGHARPTSLLIQNGRHDVNYPSRETDAFHQAASSPRRIRWYDADHDLNDQAASERDEFLLAQLDR